MPLEDRRPDPRERNADYMGLGKTVQMLSLMCVNRALVLAYTAVVDA